jgi:hypothetical protein
MTVQHDEARRLLPIIISAAASHQLLTYQTAAEKLGRPRNNARMVAQVCDLLDAAAALAEVPLLALNPGFARRSSNDRSIIPSRQRTSMQLGRPSKGSKARAT